MIPKTIHYCWFGGKLLSMEVKKCIKSWRKHCPDYEIVRWDESNFDINAHPFTRSAYEAKKWAFVSDYARLKAVYENGGIYLDTDVEILKNLDFLREYECYMGVEQNNHRCNTGLGFGAERYNPIVKNMLDEYEGLVYSLEKEEDIVCPFLNHRILRKLGYEYKNEPVRIGKTLVLPPRYLDPFSIGGNAENLLCDDTVSIHHYGASWCGGKVVFRRKMLRILGAKNTYFLRKMLKG